MWTTLPGFIKTLLCPSHRSFAYSFLKENDQSLMNEKIKSIRLHITTTELASDNWNKNVLAYFLCHAVLRNILKLTILFAFQTPFTCFGMFTVLMNADPTSFSLLSKQSELHHFKMYWRCVLQYRRQKHFTDFKPLLSLWRTSELNDSPSGHTLHHIPFWHDKWSF